MLQQADGQYEITGALLDAAQRLGLLDPPPSGGAGGGGAQG